MNAKSVPQHKDFLSDNTTKASPVEAAPRRFRGQDIFVEDDPALKEQQRSAASEVTENSGVEGDLRTEKLTYIHQMLGELRKLSQSLDEPMVAYLIEMALLETDTALNVGQFRDELNQRPDPGF